MMGMKKRTIPKGGKRRSGQSEMEKRKIVRQKTPNVSGAKPPKRIDNVPFSKNKKPINLKNVRKAMNKGGFPDLSGDGKVTKKDVLMGRGVIKKPKTKKKMKRGGRTK